MAEITPLMLQYQKVKAGHPDEVLFFRLGDFYEMFDADAVEVSRLLNLTLTHRVGSPMCGIPYHASKIYIARLLRLGKKIAICEQTSTPGVGKGLTERKVVEVITPGSAVEEEYLESGAPNYLAALYTGGRKTGFAYIDVSTANFFATSWDTADMAGVFARELGRCSPRELLLPQSLQTDSVITGITGGAQGISVSWYPDWLFSPELSYKKLTAAFGTVNLRSFSLTENSPEVPAAGFLLDYLEKRSGATGSAALPHVTGIKVYRDTDYVIIDDASRRNLEIEANLRDGSRSFTLFESINFTLTAMGNRMLRNWLAFPLHDSKAIQARQESVRQFVKESKRHDKVRELLATILDIERLAGRIAMDKAHAKDVQALRKSLDSWLAVRKHTDEINFSGIDTAPANEIIALVSRSILDEPSTLLNEGGIIREGWSKELDHYRLLQTNSASVMEQYIDSERTATGIAGLKIRSNRMIGYYIEVSKGKLPKVPEHFILRRTLVNGDCYTTSRLTELEAEITGAEARIIEEERRLFLEVRSQLKAKLSFLFSAAQEIAFTDVTSSFAHAAVLHDYVCPQVDGSGIFKISGGRHPVVELHLPLGEFVPNDACFDDGKTFALITGPNMAGKSTYLRQNALITLLAQIGSFVPAREAHIGIVDRIFCRVGASDNLARGESTFLVEMTETALILREATDKSLVIMDEVGRGTSTEDGLSIAWAVSEYLLDIVKCKTLFATHYHELTRITHPALRLLCLKVLEQDGNVVFLKQIVEGASANSYGIHVARLAGIPESVIARARGLLARFQTAAGDVSKAMGENTKNTKEDKGNTNAVADEPPPTPVSVGLFSDEELIIDEILSLKPDAITPLEALQLVTRWKKGLLYSAS